MGEVIFGRFAVGDVCVYGSAGDSSPTESVVDACGAGVCGSEKDYLTAIFAELFEGLLAESVCDAAAAVVRACGDLADAGEARVCTRSHDAAGAGQCVAVSFEEYYVTVVIGFFAEEDAHWNVGVFRPECVLPEIE